MGEINETVLRTFKEAYGEYTRSFLKTEYFKSNENLSREAFLSFFIETKLQENRLKIKEGLEVSPILLVDFGAGEGWSFVKFAERYGPEIDSGELVLCCTDLDGKPTIEMDRKTKCDLGLLSDVNLRFKNNFYDLVDRIHWIRGRVDDLIRTNLTLPDGSILPIIGNVDLVNEDYALEWIRRKGGTVDDMKLTIAKLATLLKPEDSMLLISEDYDSIRLPQYTDPLIAPVNKIYINKDAERYIQYFERRSLANIRQIFVESTIPVVRIFLEAWKNRQRRAWIGKKYRKSDLDYIKRLAQ